MVTVVEKQDPPKETESGTSGGYVLAESSSRLYTAAELQGLSSEQLRYARNEIYARHGRRFNDSKLQAYFDAQSWYSGTIAPENFDYYSLSSIERQNIATIQSVEASR